MTTPDSRTISSYFYQLVSEKENRALMMPSILMKLLFATMMVVSLHAVAVEERRKCLSETSSKVKLECENENYVLQIHQAFLGKTSVGSTCSEDIISEEDCRWGHVALTDAARGRCNFQTPYCKVHASEFLDDGGRCDWHAGEQYIAVDYSCIPCPETVFIPFDQSPENVSEVALHSATTYPALTAFTKGTTCTVENKYTKEATFDIDIFDLSHGLSDEEVPYCVKIEGHDPICAVKGHAVQQLQVTATQFSLTFPHSCNAPQDFQHRFWMTIKVSDCDLSIHCYQDDQTECIEVDTEQAVVVIIGAGVAAGVVLFLILLCIIICCCWPKRKSSAGGQDPHRAPGQVNTNSSIPDSNSNHYTDPTPVSNGLSGISGYSVDSAVSDHVYNVIDEDTGSTLTRTTQVPPIDSPMYHVLGELQRVLPMDGARDSLPKHAPPPPPHPPQKGKSEVGYRSMWTSNHESPVPRYITPRDGDGYVAPIDG